MTPTTMITDFYCNQKFYFLSVDLERRSAHSCCAAAPSKIDIQWIKKNPGKLFNTPRLQQERQDMLANVAVDSCKTNCWNPEQNNLVSRRMMHNGQIKTHTDINSRLEVLNIVLGSSCNLTCSYCDKQYSSAWLRDLKTNGAYLDLPKFNLTRADQILSNISQNEHLGSDGFDTLTKEIGSFDQLDKIIVTGGEPFLFNKLPQLLNNLGTVKHIEIVTGLGVGHDRLKNQLDKIDHIKNLKMFVSAENINRYYEFNRYGNSYDNFCKNLELLRNRGFDVEFTSVVSNVTIFGLIDFVDRYGDENINYLMCNDPDFLKLGVLDPNSKDQLIAQLESSTIAIRESIIQNLQILPTEPQRQQFSIFVKEFARRRELSLDIFPDSMLQWLE